MDKYQEALDELVSQTDQEIVYHDEINGFKSTLQELVDKATPKKPILEYVIDGSYYKCSVCGALILEKVMAESVNGDLLKEDCSYCSRCGTKVDWE